MRMALSLCMSCRRNTTGGTCLSFPTGIPEGIWLGEDDHRQPIGEELPYDGDPEKAWLLDQWLLHSGRLTDSLTAAYNPRQRRDKRGRWTSGGFGAVNAPLGEPHELSMEEMDNINGLGGRGRGSMINCQQCVAAYEMRRRGYDVRARLGDGGDFRKDGFMSWWVDPKSGLSGRALLEDRQVFLEHSTATLGHTSASRQVRAAYPPGSRGALEGTYRNSYSGHVVNWEYDTKGRVSFFDAQSGEVLGPGHGTFGSIDVHPNVGHGELAPRLIRLDDLEPSVDMNKAIVDPATYPVAQEMKDYAAQHPLIPSHNLADFL